VPARATQALWLPMRVWDAPTRLFHWLLAALVVFSYVSIRLNWLDLHMLSGEAILALLLFRLVWGVVGSQTARFGSLLGHPLAALRHLGALHRREPDTEVGHNAAGGWMVLLLLVAVLVQVVSGLLAYDADAFIGGPLTHLVAESTGGTALTVHQISFTVLEILVALHVLAVLFYAVVKRHDLVRPMITGKKRLPAITRAPRMASPWLAAVIFAVAALLVWLLVTRI
jgi:cytochrome b